MTVFNYRFGSTLSAGQILSLNSKIEKNDPRKPNILRFNCLQSTSLELNDEVKYYDLDNNFIFGGYIQNIEDLSGIQTITVADYSIKLSQEKISEVYTAQTIEAILEDIIDNYTELTYVSDVTTGITISKIVFNDEWIIDAINKLLELFNGTYNVDTAKNITFKVKSSSFCSKSLVYGVDSIQGKWKSDIEKKAEKVIVKGAVIDQRTTETLSGTGTEFETTYKPENIEISGLQQTTENIDGDYEVDVENSTITFNSSQTNPVVSYTYQSTIRVEIGSGKTVELEKKYISSKLDARKLAFEYQNRFSDGAQSSKWFKNSSDISSFDVGELINVTDETNNKSGNYIINRVILELPKKMIVEVGETDDDLFDWQKETIERIKQLEKKNQNSDYITVYQYLKDGVTVNIAVSITELRTVTDDGTILFASETTLSSDGDLISDTGIDDDYALAYDDSALPASLVEDYV